MLYDDPIPSFHDLRLGLPRGTTRSAQKDSKDDGRRGGFPARAIRRLWVAASGAALLALVALPSAAQDVCSLKAAALQLKLERSAADIAAFYATTARPFSLNEGGLKGVHLACNWSCSSASVITPMVKAFGFLKYNCSRTAAPPTTRRPTGSGTDSEMGLSVTDNQYRDAADAIFRSTATGVGDLMRVPTALENASKSGVVQDLIDAVVQFPGATWLKFSSTSVDNVNSQGVLEGAARILVRVPDSQDPPRFEQWIQIAINGSTGRLGRNVDFVARQLVSDVTSPLNDDTVVVFRGYSRTASGFVPEGRGTISDLSKCYSCHPSGLRPVIPATAGSIDAHGDRAIKPEGTMLSGPDPAKQLETLKDITSELSRFGPVGLNVSENGPPFGPSSRPRRAEFVATGCAKDVTDDRRKEIVDRMDCEQCHDSSTRGILNAGTSRITIYHKVVKNMEAPMPPGVNEPGGLTAAEREILYKCLRAEYAEILRGWLTADLLMPP